VHYANTYGQVKFLFATDWPVIEPERAIKDIDAHNYRPGSYIKMMRENALKIFNLPREGLATRPADWATILPDDRLAQRLQTA
jgi:hypothetical protein